MTLNVRQAYADAVNQLSFQPVPTQRDLQSRMPAGRPAVTAKPYVPSAPAFGPESIEYVRRQAEELDLLNDPNDNGAQASPLSPKSPGNYAGASSYF